MAQTSKNPVAEYALAERIGPTELAARLGVSKGSAHELMHGKRGVGRKTAERLSRLTGKPWHTLMSPGVPA